MGLWQHRMVKITAWICILTLIGAWVASTVKCGVPVSINWQVDPIPPRQCPSGYIMYFYMGPSNFITDVLILCIPFPLISHLKSLNKKKRILLYCLFGSGALIVLICGLRIVLSLLGVYGISPAASKLGYRLAWSSRENFTSVIIVNVPIIFGSLQGIFRKDRHLTSRDRGSNNTLSINDLDSNGKPIFSKRLSKMQTAAEFGPNIDLEKQGTPLVIENYSTKPEPSQRGSGRFGVIGRPSSSKSRLSTSEHVENVDIGDIGEVPRIPEKAKPGDDAV